MNVFDPAVSLKQLKAFKDCGEEALQTTSIPWGSIVYTVDPLLFGHLVGIEATAIHQKPDLNALS